MERDYRGWTALDRAAHQGDLPEIERLLNSGANPNDGDLGGYTPLYRALKAGQERAALRLLAAVDRAPSKRLQNPISEAVADLLPENPVSPDKLLRLAASNGLADFVARMLELNRATPRAQEIALQCALAYPEIVARLLKQPGVKSLDEALDLALTEDHQASAELLLENGAQPCDRSLEHCVHHQLPLLENLRGRFPSQVAQAEARVRCQHDNIREWEFGRYCAFCGARWP
ncbi:ankyrin repeat domain-containing protein [bacterium]|nr:ankyrin repeat domain-containing protein [bacterium]